MFGAQALLSSRLYMLSPIMDATGARNFDMVFVFVFLIGERSRARNLHMVFQVTDL